MKIDPEVDRFLENWDEQGLDFALNRVAPYKIKDLAKADLVMKLWRLTEEAYEVFQEDKDRLELT